MWEEYVDRFNVPNIPIDKDFVSIFASGFSAYSLADREYQILKEKTFMIGTNGFIKKWIPALHVWSDEGMTNMMDEWVKNNDKKCLFMTRPDAFLKHREKHRVYNMVDFWFCRNHYELDGSFTFFWVLQLIVKFFPSKKILVFGLDGHVPPEIQIGKPKNKLVTHGYDLLDTRFIKKRESDWIKNIDAFMDALEKMDSHDKDFFKNVFNCNLDSKFKTIKKIPYEKILLTQCRASLLLT
jgi:hypothetical protein